MCFSLLSQMGIRVSILEFLLPPKLVIAELAARHGFRCGR